MFRLILESPRRGWEEADDKALLGSSSGWVFHALHVTGLSLVQSAGPTSRSQPAEESQCSLSRESLEWGYPATPGGGHSGCSGPL